MKSDRQTYARENYLCEPDELSAVCLPAMFVVGSTEVGKCRSHSERLFKKETLSFRPQGEIFLLFRFLTPRCGIRNDRSDFLNNADKKHLAMTDWRSLPVGCLAGNNPPLAKPPTGFSESDIGEFTRCLLARHICGGFGGPPGVECDVGRMLDELVSSELETTRLADAEVHDGCCLTLDSRRFQLCRN